MKRQEEWQEIEELKMQIPFLMERAREAGLDFFDMRFELCPAEVLYTFGAYGMPNRFSHWSFGKAYYRLKMQYDYNLSRIYELVINSNPCYAFLLDGNSLIQNKLVVAHVLAHSDFFKNNFRFAGTSRWMLESMAASARRIEAYEFRYGREVVERFLDAVLSIQEHVDPYAAPGQKPSSSPNNERRRSTPYDDLWGLDYYLSREGERGKGGEARRENAANIRRVPASPERDLLWFLIYHAPDLDDWQRDILAILREEMLYFRPQMETKIMNEGWATYWHLRLLREMDLPQPEALEFARLHAQVTHPYAAGINPYLVGLRIFEDVERRWGDAGREKIFEVRETETDVSFIRNYLTAELVEELDLYLFRRVGLRWQVVEKEWEKVREGIVALLVNCGIPLITVEDADYRRQGELYLRHHYEGVELDIPYAEKTLEHMVYIWGRPVHLETVIDGRPQRISCDGGRATRTPVYNL